MTITITPTRGHMQGIIRCRRKRLHKNATARCEQPVWLAWLFYSTRHIQQAPVRHRTRAVFATIGKHVLYSVFLFLHQLFHNTKDSLCDISLDTWFWYSECGIANWSAVCCISTNTGYCTHWRFSWGAKVPSLSWYIYYMNII